MRGTILHYKMLVSFINYVIAECDRYGQCCYSRGAADKNVSTGLTL